MSEEKNVPKLRFPGFTEPWEQRKLGEYVSITSGEAPSKFEVGTELYVKVDDLNYNDKYVVDTQNKVAEHSTVKRVTKGSVVFPKRGAAIMTNKVRIMGIDGYMDTNMMALTSEKLDSEFLYNIISKEGLYKIADTSTIPQINNKHVEPYEVTIPSLDEQRKIGAYFKQLDHLITLHQRKLGHVKDLKKSMLQKMFPKNGELYPEVRFPGFTAAWEQRKLEDFGIATGGTSIESEFSEDGKYKVISIGSYSENSVYNDQGIRAVESEKTLKRVLNKGDLTMILNDKTTLGNIIGRALLIEKSGVYVYNQRTERIEINDEEYDSLFIYEMLNTPNIREKIIKQAQGNTQIYVNWSVIALTEYLIPKKEEQIRIGQYFGKLDKLITLHQRELDHLQLLKKGMLQQMFV